MHTFTASPAQSAFFPHFPPEWARRAPFWLGPWIDRLRQRIALTEPDDRSLVDIGVIRAKAEAERRRWD